MAKTNRGFTKHSRDTKARSEALRLRLEKMATDRDTYKKAIAEAVHQANLAIANFKVYGTNKHHGLALKQAMEASLKNLSTVQTNYAVWSQTAVNDMADITTKQTQLLKEIESLSAEDSTPRWKRAIAKAAAQPLANPIQAAPIQPRAAAQSEETSLLKESLPTPTVVKPAAYKSKGFIDSVKHVVEYARAPGASKSKTLLAAAEEELAQAIGAINTAHKPISGPLDDLLAEHKHLSTAYKAVDEAKQAEAAAKAPVTEAAKNAWKATREFLGINGWSDMRGLGEASQRRKAQTKARLIKHDLKREDQAGQEGRLQKLKTTATKWLDKRAAAKAASHTPPTQRVAPDFGALSQPTPIPGANLQAVAFINTQRDGILATLADVLNAECPDIVEHDRNVEGLSRHILNKAVTRLKACDIPTGNIEQLAEQAIVEAHKETLKELRADMVVEAAKAEENKASKAAVDLLQDEVNHSQISLWLTQKFQKELGAEIVGKMAEGHLQGLVNHTIAQTENFLYDRDFNDIEAAQLLKLAVDSAYKTMVAKLRNPPQQPQPGDFKPNAGAVLNKQDVKRDPRSNRLMDRIQHLDTPDQLPSAKYHGLSEDLPKFLLQKPTPAAPAATQADTSLSIPHDEKPRVFRTKPAANIKRGMGMPSKILAITSLYGVLGGAAAYLKKPEFFHDLMRHTSSEPGTTAKAAVMPTLTGIGEAATRQANPAAHAIASRFDETTQQEDRATYQTGSDEAAYEELSMELEKEEAQRTAQKSVERSAEEQGRRSLKNDITKRIKFNDNPAKEKPAEGERYVPVFETGPYKLEGTFGKGGFSFNANDKNDKDKGGRG